jgi:iron-sulfur cluster repair protein YtfE (RIC family)
MAPEHDSIEHAVAEQHRRLDAMFEEALAAMREGAAPDAIRDAFERLREALEAHLAQEDRLYFPSLCALRPVHRSVLDGLVASHDGFRSRLEEIDAQLGTHDLGEAERALGAFCGAFTAHEASEERLLRSIDAEVAEAASSR